MISIDTLIMFFGFLIYGYIVSYIVANITGDVKNKRGIRLHHYELGYWLFVINMLIFCFSLLFFSIISYLFLYMGALSFGILLSDIKDLFKGIW